MTVDSLYQEHQMLPVWRDRYDKILQLKADALLMDEPTMQYFA
jgi:hypothetical protein